VECSENQKVGSIQNGKRNFNIVLVLISTVFLFLKVRYLITVPLWFDEGLTFFYTGSNSFGELIDRIMMYEQNPFLFYFLCWQLVRFFGSAHPVIIRSIPFIASVVSTITLYYLYVEFFHDKWGGKVAALFLFVSTYFTLMTCDARGYSLALMLILLGTLYYSKTLKNQRYSFLLFCIFWILALKVHYLSLVFLAVIALHYLIHNRDKQIKGFIAAFLLIFVSFIPEIIQVFLVMKDPVFLPGKAEYSFIPELFYISLVGYSLEFSYMFIWYILAFLSFLLFLLPLFQEKKEVKSLKLFYGIFILVFLSTFIPSLYFNINIFSTRHFILILPFFLSILAFGISKINSNVIKYFVAGLLILLNFFSTFNLLYKPRFQREDFRTTSAILRSNLEKDDVVILNNGYQKYLLMYYMPELDLSRGIFIEKGDAERFRVARVDSYKRIWLVISTTKYTDPDMLVLGRIVSCFNLVNYCEIERNDAYSTSILLFEKPGSGE
jgi:hypothetical protein